MKQRIVRGPVGNMLYFSWAFFWFLSITVLSILELPKLLFRSVSTQLNESAVLKCFEDGFKQVAYLQTKWFKNNAEINSIEGRYLIFGNVLVILRTTVADEGNYTCQVAFQTWTHVNRSAVQRLSIETGLLSLFLFVTRAFVNSCL